MLTDEELKWAENPDLLPFPNAHSETVVAAVEPRALRELTRVYRAVQSGEWVLVPKEPTTAMALTGADVFSDLHGPATLATMAGPRIYRAMLAAAPELEKP